MEKVFSLIARLKTRERKLLEVFLITLISILFLIKVVHPKYVNLQKEKQGLKTLQTKQRTTQGVKKDIAPLEEEKKLLTQKLQEILKKKGKENTGTKLSSLNLISFFSGWTLYAQENNVKIISIKPVE
jgi:type II secretory pathway component PulM